MAIIEELLVLIVSASLYIIRVITWVSKTISQIVDFLVSMSILIGVGYAAYWLGGKFIIAGIISLAVIFFASMALWAWKPKRFRQLTRSILK